MSKTGLKVVPAFVVFHICPLETATKYSLLFFGSTAKSEILPEVSAGPIFLHFRPEKFSFWRVLF
ncbi:MAG: hypothetical protein IPJ75_12175 [Ignavibacteriales bacterium]|nr:hypothetical protein [Ignavibacteriales bacterium]